MRGNFPLLKLERCPNKVLVNAADGPLHSARLLALTVAVVELSHIRLVERARAELARLPFELGQKRELARLVLAAVCQGTVQTPQRTSWPHSAFAVD